MGRLKPVVWLFLSLVVLIENAGTSASTYQHNKEKPYGLALCTNMDKHKVSVASHASLALYNRATTKCCNLAQLNCVVEHATDPGTHQDVYVHWCGDLASKYGDHRKRVFARNIFAQCCSIHAGNIWIGKDISPGSLIKNKCR